MRPDELLREFAARTDLDHRDRQAIIRAALELWPSLPLYSLPWLEAAVGIPTRTSVLAAWTRTELVSRQDKLVMLLGPAFVWGFFIGGVIGRFVISAQGITGELEGAAIICASWALAAKPVGALRRLLLRRGVARMSFERAFALAIAPVAQIFDGADEKKRELMLFTVRNTCKRIVEKCAPRT